MSDRDPHREHEPADVWVIDDGRAFGIPDDFAVEEPLEIRLAVDGSEAPIAVTMRTPAEGLHVADGWILQDPIGLHLAVPSLRRFSPVLSEISSCPLYLSAAQDHTLAACLAINLTEKESNITTSPVTFTS